MVVSSRNDRRRLPRPARGTPTQVIWHDLECGSYRADLPLWRELADRYPGPILDIGAGTGRVALDLDPVLLAALRERAADAKVQTVCADAGCFELGRHDFGLCVVPMQTVQLLGGSAERVAFLRRARAHLRRGGMLACAILSALEPFDCADGSSGPAPETARVGGTLYLSRPTRVGVLGRSVLIERERRILEAGERPGGDPLDGHRAVERAAERNVIELDRVSASELEREAIKVGLRPEPAREVAPTDDHVGSAVVMLRA